MSEACAETAVWPRDQLIVSLTDFHRLPLVLTVSRSSASGQLSLPSLILFSF